MRDEKWGPPEVCDRDTIDAWEMEMEADILEDSNFSKPIRVRLITFEELHLQDRWEVANWGREGMDCVCPEPWQFMP